MGRAAPRLPARGLGVLYRAATAVAHARAGDAFDEGTVLSFLGEDFAASHAAFVRAGLEGRGHGGVDSRAGGDAPRLARGANARRARVGRHERAEGGRGHDVVVDGRDIRQLRVPGRGPQVFLIADPWERARRRLTQRHGRAPSDAEIAEETERLVQRDARDATQTVQAKDAIIDTTYLTQAEQVERIVSLAGIFRGGGQGAGTEPQG